MDLKNKRILITAGPTWVPIDNVRVISNIATGETGIILAEKLLGEGAKVTLLLGPVEACCIDKRIKLIRFKLFDQLAQKIRQELKNEKYHAVIASAAVSDYRPARAYSRKVNSGLKRWCLDLVATPKIIDSIKRIDGALFLVGFKFIPAASKERLINEALKLSERASADLVVANTVLADKYRAYIVRKSDIRGPLSSKASMARALVSAMEEIYA